PRAGCMLRLRRHTARPPPPRWDARRPNPRPPSGGAAQAAGQGAYPLRPHLGLGRQGAGCVTPGGIRSVVKVVDADVVPRALRAVRDGAIRLVAQLDQARLLDLDVVEVIFCLADAAQRNDEVWNCRA